jgi:nucleotide-binding universal stress UspA family protein
LAAGEKDLCEVIMKETMKLLIAYDGSESADKMLTDLQYAGLPRKTEALVISVADIWIPPEPLPNDVIVEAALAEQMTRRAREKALQTLAEVRKLALQAAKQIVTSFPDWEVRDAACAGSPAWEIIKVADEGKPDLIVLGSQGRGAIGKLWFGSVSQKVVNEAHCSARVARGHSRNGPVKIVIGVDGSPDSSAAVQSVAERDWPAGSKVLLVTSVGSAPTGYFSHPLEEAESSVTMQQAMIHAESLQQKLESELSETGLTVSSLISQVDPKHALLQEAEKWNADSIFIGSRGVSRFKRFLLGSVSSAVVARAHCSVEVVRGRG